MRFRHVIGACALTLSAASCSLGDTSDAGSINLYVEVNPIQLTVGQGSMTITVTARNVGNNALTLTGPSDCLLFVDVLDSNGIIVWTSNGGCVGASVTEELSPGQDKVQVFIWNGSNSNGALLGPGLYHIRAVARVTTGAQAAPPVSVAID